MKQDYVAAFAEWDRRWRANPENFWNVVTHLMKETPATYGEACAVYFEALLAELSKEPDAPRT